MTSDKTTSWFECRLCKNRYENQNSFKSHLKRAHSLTWCVYRAKETGEELLSCQVCGFSANNLNTHIIRTHGMKSREYFARFPSARLFQLTETQIDRMREVRQAKDSKNKRFKADKKTNWEVSWSDVLQCQLCSFSSPASLLSHIRHKHAISPTEYRAKFVGSVLQRNSIRQKARNSQANKLRLEDPDAFAAFTEWRSYPSELKHWVRKGMTEVEARKMVSEFQRAAANKAWEHPENFAKRNEGFSDSGNPMSLTSISIRAGVTEREARKLTPCYGRSGEKHPMFGKKHSEEALAKIASAPHLANPDYRSAAEREIADYCYSLCAGTKHNVRIGRWNVDVLFPEGLVVEYFGDYWHMNPRVYSGDAVHNLMQKTASQIWERDDRKLCKLAELGYHVIVVWESDWRADKNAVRERLKDAYDRVR